MREYSKVSSRFWTGDTGKRIRALGPVAQVVAMYLMTAPGSNMIGLYYLPLPTLAHETGIPFEGASEALRSLRTIGFARYDEASEVVWVPEMARHQLGDTIKPADKRHAGLLRELSLYAKCPYHNEFIAHYRDAFALGAVAPVDDPSKGLRRGLQGPSKPGAGERAGAGSTPPNPPPAEGGAAKVGARARRRQPAGDDAAPLPFTIAELLAELHAGSGGRVVIAPYPTHLSKRLTEVIRELAGEATLADARLAGEYIATWPADYLVDVAWVATAGKLAGAIGKGRKWHADGRPARSGGRSTAPAAKPDYAKSNYVVAGTGPSEFDAPSNVRRLPRASNE
jgi:hypothetical protein